MPPLQAVERLVGLQAQVPRDPYVALWSRLDRFRPEPLSDAIAERRAVRMGLLRATLHLVTAVDATAIRPVVGPVMERVLHSQSPYGRAVDGIDPSELAGTAAAALAETPRTRADLGALLAQRWPSHDAASLAWAASYLLPMVQVPPRGLWKRSGPSAFTTMEAWLGRSDAGVGSSDELLMRYLAAFGPATAADARTWSGLTGITEVFGRLRPRLRTFRDERGRELLDVQDGALPDPDVSAPARFLPEYDNAFLSHADRSRIVADEVRKRSFAAGWGQVLVDGFIAARWRDAKDGALDVEPYRRLGAAERSAVEDEGARLARFLGIDGPVRLRA
jgi:hypothetical protein